MNNKIDLSKIGFISIGRFSEFEPQINFYIDSYQRGYKWGKSEVEYLLNDIFENKQSKYPLQPLVVCTGKRPNQFELIDGQQRLTTIFIILSILKRKYIEIKKLPYSITYNTRTSSAEFLINISNKGLPEVEIINEDDILNSWKTYIISHPIENNIDNFHFFQAYHYVYKWLSLNSASDFYKKLWNDASVIWYPIKLDETNQTVQRVFLNLNSGKIKLTAAELIKALFILNIDKSSDPFDLKQFKKNELAQEWDDIERKLNDEKFWNFIINTNKEDYKTRIGLVFDILCKKKEYHPENYSYFQYSDQKIEMNWQKVTKLFNQIEEWFIEDTLFHRIGFLVNARIKSFDEIVELAENTNKSNFFNNLNKEISVYLKKERKIEGDKIIRFSYEGLNYETDKNDCQVLLLLYNIITIEKYYKGMRFPFDLYQNDEWSVEHIHPQNPRQLESKAEALDWLDDFKKRLELPDEELNNLQTALIQLNESKLTRELSNKLEDFIEKIKDTIGLHHIGNLALLDKKTNSKIGNKKFLEKRKIILNISKNDAILKYVPISTLNCFLKKSNKDTESIQMNFWSETDSDYYWEDIKEVLGNYLP